MRINLSIATTLALGTLVACGGGSTDAATTDPTTGVVLTSTAATGDTAPDGPSFMDPAAVGFELDAVHMADGTLAGYTGFDSNGNPVEVPPTMFLTFASAAFFDASDQATQDAESCIAYGSFDVAPMTSNQIPTNGTALLWGSYEGALSIEFTTCQGVVDPALWGENAVDLLTPFEGAHIGYGFGPLTTYLEDQWGADSLTEYDGKLFANYIAINDANGDWIGQDWTSAILFEWDAETGELVADDDSYLIPIDISATPPGARLPEGYLRSFAYWYQDFPLMDFSNLTDGAP